MTLSFRSVLSVLAVTVLLVGCGKKDDVFSEPSTQAPIEDSADIVIETDETEESEVAVAEPEEAALVVEDTPEKKILKVTKFSDYSCSVCKEASNTLFSLKKELGDAMELELVNFNIYPQSRTVALVSECAREQDKALDFHQEYYNTSFGKVGQKDIMAVAESVGVDTTDLSTCLESDRPGLALDQSKAYAQELGVTGTPYFLINDTQIIPGFPRSKSQFRQMILDARES